MSTDAAGDTLLRFITHHCHRGEPLTALRSDHAYRLYTAWCRLHGMPAVGQRRFLDALTQAGWTHTVIRGGVPAVALLELRFAGEATP